MKRKNVKPISLALALVFTLNTPLAFGEVPTRPVAQAAVNILSTPQTAQPLSKKVALAPKAAAPAAKPALPKLTAAQQKEINDFGNDLDKRVDQFINEYNAANPPYVFDQSGLDNLLKFGDDKMPPDEGDVQEKILDNMDRLESSKVDTSDSLGEIVYNSETLPLRHKAELFAESIARGTTFHNATARIETTLTYLFVRFIAQPENRRALIALILGFRDFKFNKAYSDQFRLDHAYWYNSGRYGLVVVLTSIFLIKFAAPRFQRLSGSFLKNIADWFTVGAEEAKPLDPSMRLTYNPTPIEPPPRPTVDPRKQLSTKILNEKGELVDGEPTYYNRGRKVGKYDVYRQGIGAAIAKDAAPTAAEIAAALESTQQEVRNSLIGRFMNLDPQKRVVWILTRVGAISLASMFVGGGRYALEKRNIGHWNEVSIDPEDEINTVLAPVLGLRLECEATQFEKTLSARNYSLSSDDTYRKDIETLNSLVEEYALLRLPLKNYDREDLTKYMARVNDGKLLEGHVSISMDHATDQIHFERRYKADPLNLDFSCAGGSLDLSMKNVKDIITSASSLIQSANVLQNIEQALANLLKSLAQDPNTVDAGTFLRSFDVAKDDYSRLPDNVQVIFRHYSTELLDLADDQFNAAVGELASQVKSGNGQGGTAAFLAYLQMYMTKNQSGISAAKMTPFEVLGVHKQ